MNKRKYEAYIEMLIRELKPIMNLCRYDILLIDGEPRDEGAAQIDMDDNYLRAKIKTNREYHEGLINKGDFREVVADIVHELVHLYTSEIENYTRSDRSDVVRTLIEQNTELITRTLMNLLPKSLYECPKTKASAKSTSKRS